MAAEAVATLSTEPWSTSACVTTYDAVQVSASPGSSEPDGHVTVTGTAASFGSATATSESVTLPSLVSVNA